MKKILFGLLSLFLLIIIISAIACAHDQKSVAAPSPELVAKIASLEDLKKEAFPSMESEEHMAFYGKELDEFTLTYAQFSPKALNSPFSKDPKLVEFYKECIRKNRKIDEQAQKLHKQYHFSYQTIYQEKPDKRVNFMTMNVYLREKLFQAGILMANNKPSEAMDMYLEHLRLCSLNLGNYEICDVISIDSASECLSHMNLPLLLSSDQIDAQKYLNQLNQLSNSFSRDVFQFSDNFMLIHLDKNMKNPSGQDEQKIYSYGSFLSNLMKDYQEHPEHYMLGSTKEWLGKLDDQFDGDFQLMSATGEYTEFYQYLNKWGVLRRMRGNVREMVVNEFYFQKDSSRWSLKEQLLLSPEARVSLHIYEGKSFSAPSIAFKIRAFQRQFDMVRLALSTRIYLDKQGELPQSPEVLIDKKMVAPLICQNEKYDYVSYYEETNDPVATDQLLLDNILVKLPYLTFSHNPCFSFGYNETLKQSTVSYKFAELPVAQKIADSMFFYSGWFKRIDNRKDILLQKYSFIRPKNALCIFAYGEDGDSDGGLQIAKPNPCVIYSSAVEDGDVILPVIMK